MATIEREYNNTENGLLLLINSSLASLSFSLTRSLSLRDVNKAIGVKAKASKPSPRPLPRPETCNAKAKATDPWPRLRMR